MYREVKIMIDNVKTFIYEKDILYIIDDKTLSTVNIVNCKKIKIMESSESLMGIKFGEDIVISTTLYGKSLILENNNKVFNFNYFCHCALNKNLLICSFEERSFVYDFRKKSILFYFPIKLHSFFINKNILYARHNKNINVYDLDHISEFWQFNVSTLSDGYNEQTTQEPLDEVYKLLGVYKNQLIVHLKSGKLIALEPNTGKLLWQITKIDINNTTATNVEFGYSQNIFLDEEKGYVYGFTGQNLRKFDLEKKICILEWNSKDAFGKEFFYIRDSYLHNNQFYFSGGDIDSVGSPNYIGIFDIATKTIIWKYKMPLTRGNCIREMQITDNNIYVLDQEHNLYVYEKE